MAILNSTYGMLIRDSRSTVFELPKVHKTQSSGIVTIENNKYNIVDGYEDLTRIDLVTLETPFFAVELSFSKTVPQVYLNENKIYTPCLIALGKTILYTNQGEMYYATKGLDKYKDLTINGNTYGVVQVGDYLIIDRNLIEPIGTLGTDYVIPPSEHSNAGYFYKAASLFDGWNLTLLAENFLATIGDGWTFPDGDFYNYMNSKIVGIESNYVRGYSYNNGLDLLSLHFVGAQYYDAQSYGGVFHYDQANLTCHGLQLILTIIITKDNDKIFKVSESYSTVSVFYNPRRLIKKLI